MRAAGRRPYALLLLALFWVAESSPLFSALPGRIFYALRQANNSCAEIS